MSPPTQPRHSKTGKNGPVKPREGGGGVRAPPGPRRRSVALLWAVVGRVPSLRPATRAVCAALGVLGARAGPDPQVGAGLICNLFTTP